ncbi:MAG: hypothetical protein WCI51_07900 [Lentisphaerota bacterium]
MLKKVKILVLAFCTAIPALSQADSDKDILALTDDFSDGNIHTNPAWVAGDMNWFNPYFVEKLDGKNWATARQYGSMGTWLTLPPERIWPVALDPLRGVMKVSLTVRFKPETRNNLLSMHLIGTQSGGRIEVLFIPTGCIEIRMRQFKYLTIPIPKMLDGKPVKFTLLLGSENGVSLQREGKTVYTLDPKLRDELRKYLRSYDRLAFIGSEHVTSDNPYFMSESFKDAQGYCWFTDIEVCGLPERIQIPAGLSLGAKPRSMFVIRGFGGFDTTCFSELVAAGWTVEQAKPSVNPDIKNLAIKNLLRFKCVVIVDVAATKLGLDGCAALREYIRLGGCVFIFGGANTLNRGRYFGSQLAECLPVDGKDGMDSLVMSNESKNHEYVFDVKAKPGASCIEGSPQLIIVKFGEGRVIVTPWSTLGNPPEPFWRTAAFAKSLADLIESK